ncbi:tigger transposable element-derived protein 6-like [Tetranychus urticae]|uniref:tigger transposable element-derived protein 6-like n=1 Tax=Tetranychus urticae TaxID=32264 RepID=UPI00077BF1B0|nr:tigger transposable element-derived protein 6-like [Tetranychus urticae]
MPRRNLTIRERVNVISDRENNNSNINELCSKYNVSRWTINRVLGNREPLKEAHENGQSKRTRLEKRIELKDFDGQILEWVRDCSDKGIPMSGTMIIEFAKTLNDNFNGTWSWFYRFKERTKLKLGVKNGERLSVDKSLVDNWRKINIPRIMINWQSPFIYNCDETALFWRQTPVKTYFIPKTDHIGDKLFRERITILFCINRAGDKMAPLIINRSAKPRCFFTNCFDGLNIEYKQQHNAWMDRNIFTQWLKDLHDQLIIENKKVILLLDNFTGHKVEYDEFPLITFEFLPAGTTALTQPLDNGPNRLVKSKYISKLMKRVIEKINTSSYISNIIKEINLLDAIKWIDETWKEISSQTIVNCWNHCGYVSLDFNDEYDLEDEQDDVNNLLLELRNLNVNCCSYEELMDQNNFDFVNVFDE